VVGWWFRRKPQAADRPSAIRRQPGSLGCRCPSAASSRALEIAFPPTKASSSLQGHGSGVLPTVCDCDSSPCAGHVCDSARRERPRGATGLGRTGLPSATVEGREKGGRPKEREKGASPQRVVCLVQVEGRGCVLRPGSWAPLFISLLSLSVPVSASPSPHAPPSGLSRAAVPCSCRGAPIRGGGNRTGF